MCAIGWLLYVRVPDVHAAVKTVTDLGGRVLNGPMEVPDGDVIAQCTDPQGGRVRGARHCAADGPE